MILMKELTIREIIKRKIRFIETSNIFNEIDWEHVKDGEIKAYREMLLDSYNLTEKEFVKKYLLSVRNLKTFFEGEEKNDIFDSIEIERLVGYNNAVVFVLSLLNPEYEFDIN